MPGLRRTSRAARPWPRILAVLSLVAVSLAVTVVVPAGPADAAVVRPFTRVFSQQTNGAIQITGNTLMTCGAAASCAQAQDGSVAASNNSFTMGFLDVDADATTTRSSSADLTIPSGARVLYAGLFWGAARVAGTNGVASSGPVDTIRFRTPGASDYATLTADRVDNQSSATNDYSSYRNVTSLVQSAGAGTYWGADIAAATGSDRYAGWSLVVAVEDPARPAARPHRLHRLRHGDPDRDRRHHHLRLPRAVLRCGRRQVRHRRLRGRQRPHRRLPAGGHDPPGRRPQPLGQLLHQPGQRERRQPHQPQPELGQQPGPRRQGGRRAGRRAQRGHLRQRPLRHQRRLLLPRRADHPDRPLRTDHPGHQERHQPVRERARARRRRAGVLPRLQQHRRGRRDQLGGHRRAAGERRPSCPARCASPRAPTRAPRPTRPGTTRPSTTPPPGRCVRGSASGATATAGASWCRPTPPRSAFRVRVDSAAAGTTLRNTASLAYRAETLAKDYTYDTAEVTTPVAEEADVSITKTASAEPVTAGNQLTYTLTAPTPVPARAAGVRCDRHPPGRRHLPLEHPVDRLVLDRRRNAHVRPGQHRLRRYRHASPSSCGSRPTPRPRP